MNERYTVDNLPKGTKDKLSQRAVFKGFLRINGTPDLSSFVRDLLVKESEKKK